MCDSDSDDEGVLTNVNKLVIRPPGHTGKAKKGHICFDSGYETMNLGRVDFISDQEYDLYIRPDTANPRHRLWFYFTIDNTQAGQKVIFNFINLSKFYLLFREGLTPVVKSCSRQVWQRIPTSDVFYYKSSLHSGRYVLSFIFCFDLEDEKYHLAFAQPYSFSRHQVYIEELISSKYMHLRVETLCMTVDNRPCHILTITDPENMNKCGEIANPQPNKNKGHKDDTTDDFDTDEIIKEDDEESEPGYYDDKVRAIFIMGRQSASDSASSFILLGLINFLLSSHSIAEALRKRIIFKIVPVLNPDGAYYGNSRCNAIGQDLNRLWNKSNKYSTPTIHAAKKLIRFLDKEGLLDMVIDVHAHASLLGLFVTGNSYSDVYRFERHIVFPKFLAKNCIEMNLEQNKYNEDPLLEGTARRHLTSILSSEVNVYSLEVSVYGYAEQSDLEGERKVITFNSENYCRIGENVCRALWDFYKIIGFIPMEGDEAIQGSGKANLNSFNLLRMREIDLQRQQAFLSQEQEQENYFPSGFSSSGSNESNSPRSFETRSVKKEKVESEEICGKKKISIAPKEHIFDESLCRRSSCSKLSSASSYRIPPKYRKYSYRIPKKSKATPDLMLLNIPPATLNRRISSSTIPKRRPSDYTASFQDPHTLSHPLELQSLSSNKDTIISPGGDLPLEEDMIHLQFKRKITLRPPSQMDDEA